MQLHLLTANQVLKKGATEMKSIKSIQNISSTLAILGLAFASSCSKTIETKFESIPLEDVPSTSVGWGGPSTSGNTWQPGFCGSFYDFSAIQPTVLQDFSQFTPFDDLNVNALNYFLVGYLNPPHSSQNINEWWGWHFANSRVTPPHAGDFTIRVISDDNLRVTVADQVYEINTIHGPTTETVSAWLDAGTHPLEIEFQQGPQFHWSLSIEVLLPNGQWTPVGSAASGFIVESLQTPSGACVPAVSTPDPGEV